jgi:hypothetical protein
VTFATWPMELAAVVCGAGPGVCPRATNGRSDGKLAAPSDTMKSRRFMRPTPVEHAS